MRQAVFGEAAAGPEGQVFTSPSVCDLMLALIMPSLPDGPRILDPGCGDGIFLQRALHHFQRSCQMPRLVGIELHAETAERARQNFAGQAAVEIVTGDFLGPEGEALGVFDAVIGNPPYVRHEQMAQTAPLRKKVAQLDLRVAYAEYLQQYPEQKPLFSQTVDLYLRFYLQATRLLKPGGMLAFVTSNSFLGTSIGQAFQRFIHHHFDAQCLIESTCERWFPDAAVNATIFILRKKSEAQIGLDDPPPVRLIRFRQLLADWLPTVLQTPDGWENFQQVWADLPAQVAEVRAVYTSDRPEGFSNWNSRMRAPQQLVTLLENSAAWQRLDVLGEVRYPIKTGINRFFYLTRTQAEHWAIEPEFLAPVMKSLREVRRVRISPEQCETLLFCCDQPVEVLEKEGKTGALQYIRWGETQSAPPRQKRRQSVPWPQVASVQGRTPWYKVRALPPAQLLCSRFLDRRFLFPLCDGPLLEDQTFYGVRLHDSEDLAQRDLIAALLNSTLSFALLEFSARLNLGEGVLQFARCDMAAFPVVHTDLYTKAQRHEIVEQFALLSQRDILPVPEELRQADRRALDECVLAPWLVRFAPHENVSTFCALLEEALLRRMEERRRMACRP